MGRKDNVKANLAKLKERFPNVFFDTKPLVPTIIEDMIAVLGNDELSKVVRSAMKYYLDSPSYLKRFVRRKWIRDVNGSKVRLITDEEKDCARKRLSQINEHNSKANAEYRFAVALARETKIEYKKIELLEQNNSEKSKVVVIHKRTPKVKNEQCS
ncbi:ProQ/FINO family protein [Glaesserella sp.]|uniref:ProQ/FINO family protein n=1 Tax=Glaesserella sp. TaxID=2094731 RepID=UPI00359F659A